MLDKVIWDELDAASAAARKVVPQVVARYRDQGVLTWALLHRMEDEVAALVEATGEHDEIVLKMICSAPEFRYPKNDRPATFPADSISPIIFGQIADAWKFVH